MRRNVKPLEYWNRRELMDEVLSLRARLADVTVAGLAMEKQRDEAQRAAAQAVLVLRHQRGEVRT